MSYFSSIFTAQLVNRIRNKKTEEGKNKQCKHTLEHFECSNDVYSKVFIVLGVIIALLALFCLVSVGFDSKDAGLLLFFFGIVTLLTFFAAWVTAHQRLIVDGDDATYVNIWGSSKSFKFSDLTQCLTTEQFLYLYSGNKRVATLDKEMYSLELLEARCKSAGVEWRGKSRAGITQLTLAWHATRTVALIFFWLIVGMTVMMIPIRISSFGYIRLSDIRELLLIELYMVGCFGAIVLFMMLGFSTGLKEVWSIERTLGLSFREEMARRGAQGREYQDEEWFVEALPGKIEVLNRRFIKQWLGMKEDHNSRVTTYHVEFIDINGKKRKVGGHYQEHAVKMCQWYIKGGKR